MRGFMGYCAVCRSEVSRYVVVLAYRKVTIDGQPAKDYPIVCSRACARGLGPEYINSPDLDKRRDVELIGRGRYIFKKDVDRLPHYRRHAQLA